jgi:hypothetical protein
MFFKVTSGEETKSTMLFTIVPLRLLASYERADGGVLTGATGKKM